MQSCFASKDVRFYEPKRAKKSSSRIPAIQQEQFFVEITGKSRDFCLRNTKNAEFAR